MVSQFFHCPIGRRLQTSNKLCHAAIISSWEPLKWQNHRTAFTVGSAGAGGASILYGTVTIGGTGWAGCWTCATSCAAVTG